ncbi:MAG TPA: hypothetical protein VIZ43_31070 [Trebonia sp.]
MPADRFKCLRDAEFGSFLHRFLCCFLRRKFPELVGRQPVSQLGRGLQLGRLLV